MTTQADLLPQIARLLRDPDNLTFTEDDLRDMIGMGMSEIGTFAPESFTEDITPIADTASYQIRSDVLPDETAEIKLRRVELWDGTATPNVPLCVLNPAANERVNSSEAGWDLWNGILTLSPYQLRLVDPDSHFIRVWGYSPYVLPASDSDVINLTPTLEKALLVYCKMEGLDRLNLDRDLFTQWQTRSNASDVSPASLMNALSLARDDWRRRSSKLTVLRQDA